MRPRLTDKLSRRGTSFRVQGMVVAKPNHPEVRALRSQGYRPSFYATRVWGSSYLLIDYLSRRQQSCGSRRTIELGCGWGLVSHYLSQACDCEVMATDIDAQVFPFVELLGRLNRSRVATGKASFAKLGRRAMPHQLLVGADICYNVELAEQLDQLLLHATRQGVEQLLIADIGRTPFMELASRWIAREQAQLVEHSIELPTRYQGYILRIETE